MALLFDPNHLILNEKQSEKLFNGLLITSQVLGKPIPFYSPRSL